MSDKKQWIPDYDGLAEAAIEQALERIQAVFYVSLLKTQIPRIERGLAHYKGHLAMLERRYEILATQQADLIAERNDINRRLEQAVITDIAIEAGLNVAEPKMSERQLKQRRREISDRLWSIENEHFIGTLELEIKHTRRDISELERHLATCENAEFPPAGPVAEWLKLE